MAYSIQTAVSDGTLEVLDLSIKYMDKSHIFVYVDDVLVDGSAYSYAWLTDTRIQVTPAVASGSTLKVIRKTLTDEMWHEFSQGARFSTSSMDENFEQLLFLAQEYSEGIYITDFYSDVDMHLKRILNLGDPLNDGDAVNLRTLKEYLPNADLLVPIVEQLATKVSTQELGGSGGAGLVGTTSGMSVQEELSAERGNFIYATLRAYTGNATRIQIGGRVSYSDGASGVFIRTGSATDNDGTVLKDALGRSWVREIDNPLRPEWFGAIGDGITDCSAAFKKIEGATGSSVDLQGKVYAVASSYVNPTDGVSLRKDYVNGGLLVDNRKRIFDRVSNFAISGASKTRMMEPSTTKSLGINRADENTLYVWRPLGGPHWQRCGLTRSTNNVPFNWNETYLKQVYGYIAAQDSGVTYTGGWATTTAVSALNSADPAVYIGGRARQATAAGDYVEISYTGGGDLYVIFAGRTSGNYINVLLDGQKKHLILPDDGAGNKYFDSYTSSDLQYKQIVKIAQAVPQGTHTIRLTVSSSKNPASSGNRFVFNALSFDSSEMGPWREESDAPTWAAGQAVLANQVRKYGTRYYYATADGTTGATPPTHTSGTVSDGGVSWTYRASSGYDLLDHRIQAAGSQLEYAYEIKPTGATAREDVGGALHGNEVQTAYSLSVGGVKVSMSDGDWRVGDNVQIVESLYSTHSEIGGGATPVVVSKLSRNFKRQHIQINHSHTLQMAAELGYFYPHMWPLLHYSSIGQKYGVRKIWSPGDGYRNCSDFYGQSNPFVGRTKDTMMVVYGDALQPNGSGGVPTSTSAPMQFVAWLAVDPESIDMYSNRNTLFASKAMNTSGADVSAGGFSSMTSKLYFERYSSDNPVALQSGYTFECSAIYGLALINN